MKTSWFEIGVDIKLSNLEKYRQAMENALIVQQHTFEDWVDKQAENLTDEEKPEFYEFYSGEHWELNDVFPSTLRTSLLIASYTVLEEQLVGYCTELWTKNKIPVKPNIPPRGIIFGARNYLSTHAGISIPETSPNWVAIVSYNKIRNSIVHNGGRLNNQRLQELQVFLGSHPSITLDQFNKIILAEDACKDFITIVRNLFFNEIFK